MTEKTEMSLNRLNEEVGLEEFFPAERQQRLDLILHLIPNTRQAILLRGPEQSGKSFFLRQFDKQRDKRWQFCLIPAKSLMDTTSPLEVLTQAFDELEGNNKQLLVRLAAASKAEKKVIICIEDTHQLGEAQFDFLFKLADSYDCLQVLLSSADNLGEAIESRCQLIDLEPFTQRQTTEYARKIIQKNNPGLTNLVGLDEVVLFIETGGLPGRINDVLAQMSTSAMGHEKPTLVKSGSVIGLIALAILLLGVSVFIFYPQEESEEVPSTVVQAQSAGRIHNQKLETPAKTAITEQPRVSGFSEIKEFKTPSSMLDAPLETASKTKVSGLRNTDEKVGAVKVERSVNTQTVVLANIKAEESGSDSKEVVSIKENSNPSAKAPAALTAIQLNHQWLESRDKKHFTLQLLGVSTEESAKKFILKHNTLKPLYFFQHKRNAGQWFVVIYGDFENKKLAEEKANKMPASLTALKPWVRTFDAVQRDVLVKE